MRNMRAIGRRSFLLSLLGASVSLGARAATVATDCATGIAEGVYHALDRGEDAAAIGARYLANHPAEASLNWLVDETRGRGVNYLALQLGDRYLFLRSLEDASKADFVLGLIVEQDRWVLSRTELRVMAIVHCHRAGTHFEGRGV